MWQARAVVLIWTLCLLLAACSAGGSEATPHVVASPAGSAGLPEGALTVAQAVNVIASQASDADRHTISVVAYVNQPASPRGTLQPPPAGCPVFPEDLATLTDEPFMSEFPVAGVVLPNVVPEGVAALKLVIPYSLGIIEIPPRAHLQGHVLDQGYSDCPESNQLFILERIVGGVAVESQTATPSAGEPAGWATWTDGAVALSASYPSGWRLEETRNVGSIVDLRFQPLNTSRSVRLTVLAGETHWNPEDGSPAPAPLAGENRLPAMVGGVAARLVDAPGELVSGGRWREVRLVLNYHQNTVVLSTRFIDGVRLDLGWLETFGEMAARLRFDDQVGISDPLDPTLTARTELGTGPFIGQATAIEAAIQASGLIDAEAEDARLVAERTAREAIPGSCREFQERPEGVWLVTIRGTLPTGQQARRLVYLDAVTAESVCQTQAPDEPTNP